MKPSVYRIWLLALAPPLAAQTWIVRLEEPTGIERRRGEVVRIPLDRLRTGQTGFRVTSPAGTVVPAQVLDGALVFPADVRPGETPEYRVACCVPAPGPETSALARRVGLNRVELANPAFRFVVDLQRAAIVEAYDLSAGPQRSLNLVETTPERKDPNDIHPAPERLLQPVSPVSGAPGGWTVPGLAGPIEKVDILADGPVLAQVRFTSGAHIWDLEFPAQGPWLHWRAAAGARLANISASPFQPFDRCVDGGEYRWPTGPGSGEPPGHDIAPRAGESPPGGLVVYYQRAGNYGALAIIERGGALVWSGACSPKLELRGAADLWLAFPGWRGDETALAARSLARQLREPLLLRVTAAGEIPAPAAPTPPPPPAAGPLQAAGETPAAALPSPPPPPAAGPLQIPLDGPWQLAWGEKGAGPSSQWRTVQVPGSAHVQWLPEAQIYRAEAAWVSRKEWWYKRRVQIPASFAGHRLRLQFDATDYYAETFIDSRFAGRHEGYIDPYELDVTALLQPGREHEISVRVWTPVHYYWKHRPWTIKGAYGGVDQKPDDITALGITRGVRLVATRGAWIHDVAVATWLDSPGARVELALAAGGDAGKCRWQVSLAPRNFTGAASYTGSRQALAPTERLELRVPDARLWWTWDRGAPNLYSLDVRLLDQTGAVVDARVVPIGIREFELAGGRFYLNRQPLFLRGTNTYYHLFLSEMKRADTARDFNLMLAMNVNTIRLHCHFQNPEFYDLADEQGVLIWQDFLEAWYPHDTDFSLHAARLYDNHLRYVRNHPSVAVWAASDEEDFENYVDLAKHLAARASLLDPQRRPVIRSTGRYQDAHLYHGWYGGTIWDYAKMTENLVTEFGAASLPVRSSLDRFLKDRWPIDDHAADWRVFRLQIEEAYQAWGKPGARSLDEYIDVSQRYAARLFQIGLERTRRRKAEGASGVFHFFAIDIWPSITMAAIDYWRVPKKEYFQAQRSLAPVLASLEFDRDSWRAGETVTVGLWAVNDRLDAYPEAQLRWRVEDATGVLQKQEAIPAGMAPDSSRKVGDAVWTASRPGAYRLVAELLSGPRRLSENVFEFEIRR